MKLYKGWSEDLINTSKRLRVHAIDETTVTIGIQGPHLCIRLAVDIANKDIIIQRNGSPSNPPSVNRKWESESKRFDVSQRATGLPSSSISLYGFAHRDLWVKIGPTKYILRKRRDAVLAPV